MKSKTIFQLMILLVLVFSLLTPAAHALAQEGQLPATTTLPYLLSPYKVNSYVSQGYHTSTHGDVSNGKITNRADLMTFDLTFNGAVAGTKVYAVASGAIWFKDSCKVTLRVSEYFITYVHIKPVVAQGNQVVAGQTEIGTLVKFPNSDSNCGTGTGPHVHLMIDTWGGSGTAPRVFPYKSSWQPVAFLNLCGKSYPYKGDQYSNQYNGTTIATCAPLTTPPAPTLVSPSNGATLPIGTPVTLTWNAVSDATKYFLEWSGAATGNSGWIAATSFNASLPAGTYNWHVKARNAVGEGPFSGSWSFTLVSGPITPTPPAPFSVWVHIQGAGFEFTGLGGWVIISTQNTVYESQDSNVIYTRTRTPPYTNDVDWARWRPTIPITGYYRACVFAPYYSSFAGVTDKARYIIHHANGDSSSTQNQRQAKTNQKGYWMDLGRYQFNQGTDGYVYMGDYTGDNPWQLISADAAKFVWSPTGSETCQ